MRKSEDISRPYWKTFPESSSSESNDYAITDLERWESIGDVPAGCVCQVMWRERTHHEYRIKNVRTRMEAASFVRSKVENLGRALYDIGITPMQSIENSEFAKKPLCA